MQLHLGPWIIGSLLPGQDRWRVRCPFKLPVDEESLPGKPESRLQRDEF